MTTSVETCLEGEFLPEKNVLASFLVNALYLFGDNTLVAHGGAPAGAVAELERLGHRVSTGRPGRKEMRYDRALLLTQSFGRGGDAEISERLRVLRRSVRPGGLICFHVFDRDRAWSMAGRRTVTAEGARAQVDVGFDPSTGRLTARQARVAHPEQSPGSGAGFAVKAWNRAEIEGLLRGAGLLLERVYGDWSGSGPEESGTGRLIVVAAKPRRPRRNARGNLKANAKANAKVNFETNVEGNGKVGPT